MKMNYKKSLKFITLLIAALLIATASATIYDYMNLNATVGVQGMSLAWVSGNDASTAGTQIDGVTASLNTLKGPPNGTRIYADPIRVNNTGGSAVAFNLTISTVTGDTSYLDSIYVRLYNYTNDASIGNLTVWSGGAKGSDLNSLSIPSNTMWRFQWEITWKATATTSQTVTVNLKIQVPV
jgi:hypothetical protein